MRSLISLILIFSLSGCAIWVRGPRVERATIKGPKIIYIKPVITHSSIIDIPEYKPNEKEIELTKGIKDCIGAGTSEGATMKNAYQRRVLCEIYQELPSRLSGSEVKLLSDEDKTVKNYYEFNYFIDEHSSTWKKINFWASILTLSIIPLGTNVTMNLNVKEIKAGKPVRETSFSSERLILGGILIAPLYPFSDGVKGVTENHTRLLDGFVRWY